MIDLVLNAAPEKSIALDRVRYAFNILEFASDPIGAFHVASNLWKREASFLVGCLGGVDVVDCGIAQSHWIEEIDGRFGSVESIVEVDLDPTQVDYAELDGFSNLLSRQADAVRLDAGFDHVVEKALERGVELRNRFAFLVENLFSIVNNFQGHRSSI